MVRKFATSSTDQQLPAEYHDVESLLAMAMNEQASQQDTFVLFIAALKRMHRFVETGLDDASRGQLESNNFHNTQWEHMRHLYRRILSLEHKLNTGATGPDSAADENPGTDSSNTVFNVPNYRYEMLEKRVEELDEVIRTVRSEGHLGPHSASSSGDVMERALERMRQVSVIQQQDAMQEFARADTAREAQVDSFAEQLQSIESRFTAMEQQFRDEATKFRMMRTWLVAHQKGDTTAKRYVTITVLKVIAPNVLLR